MCSELGALDIHLLETESQKPFLPNQSFRAESDNKAAGYKGLFNNSLGFVFSDSLKLDLWLLIAMMSSLLSALDQQPV